MSWRRRRFPQYSKHLPVAAKVLDHPSIAVLLPRGHSQRNQDIEPRSVVDPSISPCGRCDTKSPPRRGWAKYGMIALVDPIVEALIAVG